MIQKLSIKQMQDIYEEHMKRDFPPNELKPFSSIKRMVEAGVYCGYVLEEEDGQKVYWMLLHHQERNAYLLDYLAVISGIRGQGYGSQALEEISAVLPKKACLILEVENPDKSENEEERQIRKKRISFYRRNHVVDTGLHSTVFKAPYNIMVKGEDVREKDREWIRETYLSFYRDILLTKEQFIKYVHMEYE